MANIRSLEGISEARNELFNKLADGIIPLEQARELERVLRGQVVLKADVPTRLLSLVLRSKNVGIQVYAEQLLKRLLRFTGGETPEIEDHSTE